MDEGVAELPENKRKEALPGQPLDFDFWLALFKLLSYHVDHESMMVRNSQNEQRRDALKTGNMHVYQAAI